MLDRHGEREGGQRDAGEDERADDLLGRVGARADGVRAEDGQRLGLGQALADLLARWQRAPDEDAAGPSASARPPASSARWPPPWPSACPCPVYRKYGACGRSTRTRRSPGLRPWSGRRPPITQASTAMAQSLDEPVAAGRPRACAPGRPRCRRPPGATHRAGPGSRIAQGARVAVARLADAARVEQRAPVVELEDVAIGRADEPRRARRPSRTDDRDVGMAVQPDAPWRMLGRLSPRDGGRRCTYSQRVARAAVDEREVALGSARRAGPPARRGSSRAIVSRVHSAAARASRLNQSISVPPRAAASWLPRTPTAPTLGEAARRPRPAPGRSRRRRRAATRHRPRRRRRGPRRAPTRLLWMSERTAIRIGGQGSSRPRSPGRLAAHHGRRRRAAGSRG